MNRIFISYKRVDKDKVFQIRDLIESHIGKDECWIDLDGIESDAQFKSVIIHAIKKCEVVLFMYSKAHTEIRDFEKDWTVRELNFASAKNKRIVFVNIDGTPLIDEFDFDFGLKQQIDGQSAESLERLIKDLRKWLNSPLQEPMRPNKQTSPKIPSYKPQENPKELYKKGLEYYQASDYTEAVKWYRKAAEQGNASAQNNLGLCFYNGQGVTRNYTEAVKWFRKAAEQGLAAAQNNLGLCFYNGQGVTQNYTEAVKWYRKAAEQDYAEAQNNLGNCYSFGQGVEQNYAEAVTLYRKAAEQRKASARFNLGICYYKGYGVTQDNAKARKWLKLAAQQGDEDANEWLSKLPE